MFLGDRLPTEECLRLGLLNCVVAEDDYGAAVCRIACQLADGPRGCLSLMKEDLVQAKTASLAEAMHDEIPRHMACGISTEDGLGVPVLLAGRYGLPFLDLRRRGRGWHLVGTHRWSVRRVCAVPGSMSGLRPARSDAKPARWMNPAEAPLEHARRQQRVTADAKFAGAAVQHSGHADVEERVAGKHQAAAQQYLAPLTAQRLADRRQFLHVVRAVRAASSSSWEPSRSLIGTGAPAWSSRSASAAPMPPAAPVTTRQPFV